MTGASSLPRVSVIVPHYNDHRRLPFCLECLHRQTYPAERLDIIVVDNHSMPPLGEALMTRWPKVRFAVEPERGGGPARNRGVALSSGEIIAFTDSDCRPRADWLERGVEHLLRPGAPAVLGGDILVFAADEGAPTEVELYEKVFGFQQKRYVTRKRFIATANMLTTPAAFERVGPFRDGRLPEDYEWGRRAAGLGLRLGFAADVVVHHPARHDWPELRRKTDRTLFHDRNLALERGWLILRWAGKAVALTAPPLLKIREILASPYLHGAGQRWGAIRGLFRQRYYRVGRMLETLSDDGVLRREELNV